MSGNTADQGCGKALLVCVALLSVVSSGYHIDQEILHLLLPLDQEGREGAGVGDQVGAVVAGAVVEGLRNPHLQQGAQVLLWVLQM